MQATSCELKYCERCGSLRLRRADSADTYCQPCRRALFNLPLGEALRSKIPIRRSQTVKSELPVLHVASQLELAYGRRP
jgi:hypothetical protein